MSLFLKFYRQEKVKERASVFALGFVLVTVWILGDAVQRTVVSVLFFFIFLALVFYFSPEGISYRSWKKVDKASRRNGR